MGTVRKINQTFDQRTISERTAEKWYQKLRTRDENLEDEEGCGYLSTIDKSQLKAKIKVDPL